MGIRWTSTSNIDRSIASGLRPCDIVRFPCGSRSMHRTRNPFSLSATPRLRVVVVFATPPFWFASASTRATAGAVSDAGTPRKLGRERRRATAMYAASSVRVSPFLPPPLQVSAVGPGGRYGPSDRRRRACGLELPGSLKRPPLGVDARPRLRLLDELAQLAEKFPR